MRCTITLPPPYLLECKKLWKLDTRKHPLNGIGACVLRTLTVSEDLSYVSGFGRMTKFPGNPNSEFLIGFS